MGAGRSRVNRCRWSYLLATLFLSCAGLWGQSESARSISGRAFDSDLAIEIEPLADGGRSRDLLVAALTLVRELERLTHVVDVFAKPEAEDRGVGRLNASSGSGPVEIDARLLLLLARSLEYCRWSRGAYGPMGGVLHGLWGLRHKVVGLPSAAVLAEQTNLAQCDRLQLDLDQGTAQLWSKSRIDLWGFARGFAIDAAVELLQQQGAFSGWVQIGHVTRAFGPGPSGKGWPMAMNPGDPASTPTERVFLRDQALAMASFQERALEVAGERFAPYIDHRLGRPAAGKVAVLAASDTALDAEALAATLFVLPNREGEFYLGALRPQPAVKWFLGSTEGTPLIMQREWSRLKSWSP